MQSTTTMATINKFRHVVCHRGGSRAQRLILFVALVQLFVTIIKGETDSAASTKILSRRRRYLVFPEGSSLQLVYDEAIPIVDYTLLVVTGETLALAYELPHKPLYGDEIWRIDMEDEQPAEEKVDIVANGNRVQDSYYFGNGKNYSTAWQNYYRERDSFYTKGGTSPWSRFDWNDRADRIAMDDTKIKDPNKAKPIIINKDYPFNMKHKIVALPMGKRSIEDNTNNTPNRVATRKEEATKQFFLQHHRSTRYKFYKLIDIYLRAHGQNGMDCVLKTLCEVAQRPRDAPKESFMAEIVRAIFRLPDADQVDDEFHHYHNATRTADACSEIFAGCPHSIWTASFLL